MSDLSIERSRSALPTFTKPMSFWQKDDWWAIVFGLGLILAGYIALKSGASLAWLAVVPAKWADVAHLRADLTANWPRYIAQGAVWLILVSTALGALGYRLRHTVPAFLLLYVASATIITIGQWDQAVKYNLEPPLLALGVGLLLANLGVLPRRLDAGFRVEFYIKLGVVLLGATLPLTLILWAGPVALFQASIVSIVTFLAIFYAARAFGLDNRFAATLGVGGAVCGVSGGDRHRGGRRGAEAGRGDRDFDRDPVGDRHDFRLAARLQPTSPARWRGRRMDRHVGIRGCGRFRGGRKPMAKIAGKVPGAAANATEQAVAAFTLMKVVGRDIWIGIWAIVLSIVATTYWSQDGITNRPGLGEVWSRFPKFVIGFFLASAFITAIAYQFGHADFNKVATPGLVAPIKNLRTWAFAFGFLSIGLTTRVRDLAGIGLRPLAAFSVGVVINVALGLVLSVVVFGGYWQRLSP